MLPLLLLLGEGLIGRVTVTLQTALTLTLGLGHNSKEIDASEKGQPCLDFIPMLHSLLLTERKLNNKHKNAIDRYI